MKDRKQQASHWLLSFLLFKGCGIAWHPPWGCLVSLRARSQGGEGGCREPIFCLSTISSTSPAVLITSQLLHFNLHLVPGLVWLRFWRGGGIWLIHSNNHSPSPQPHASLSSPFALGEQAQRAHRTCWRSQLVNGKARIQTDVLSHIFKKIHISGRRAGLLQKSLTCSYNITVWNHKV